ncbi:Ubiquitin carboxyl-terminal hydrolase 7 [Globodera pallida]|nr:Ubiquitin carboxyl-terminal hydrolase 7 [Globodera pallida]
MLGPALFKICFPLIPQKDFSTNIVLSRVLTSDQMMGVFQHYSHPDADQPGQYPLQFPTKRRTSSDPYKAKGKIVLKIEKVSEFAPEHDESNWSCAGSATFRIVSQKEGKKDHTREISRHIFNLKENIWGINYFMEFEELMDPKNGWYDAKNDTVILSAEVTAEEPIGVE